MGTFILLLVVSFCIAPVSAHLGNVSSYIMFNISLVAVMLYPLAFVSALWAGYHICCSLRQHKYKHKEVLAEDFACRLGLLNMVFILSMGYLYGFTAAPFTSQVHWWSWTLVFPVIALLPVVFTWTVIKKYDSAVK